MKQSSRAKKMIKVSQNKAPLKRNGFLTRWLTGSAATLARAREKEAPIAGSYQPSPLWVPLAFEIRRVTWP